MSNFDLLKNGLILLPYVENLTITNCWIIPNILQLIVKEHSKRALRTLTLDSVSLTHNVAKLARVLGMNRPLMNVLQNGNAPSVRRGHVRAGSADRPLGSRQMSQSATPGVGPPQVNRSQGFSNFSPPSGRRHQPGVSRTFIHLPLGNQDLVSSGWPVPIRAGSWPAILNSISPAIITTSDASTSRNTSILPLNSCLEIIEIKSCGYCLVHLPSSARFEDMDTVTGARSDAVILRYSTHYADQMLPASRDQWHAQISQHISESEAKILQDVWGMQVGWSDRSAAMEAFYDGYLEGGTGRFSGRIEKQDMLSCRASGDDE